MSLAYALAVAVAAAPVHEITGRVNSYRDRMPVQGALMILECTCLDAEREALTDADGRYRFRGLRAGTYKVKMFRRDVLITRIVELGLPK